MPRRRASPAAEPPAARPVAQVVSLSDLRLSRRLATYRARLDRVLKANKRAITRLFGTGLLFTRNGTRAGRDLLLAHEHLLRVLGLLDRLENAGDVPPPRRADEIDAVFTELDALLERTAELTDSTAQLLEDLGKE